MHLMLHCPLLLLTSLVVCTVLTSSLPRDVFLREHNMERVRLRFRALTWDEDLAQSSLTYASLCVFNHSGNSTYGESLYSSFPVKDDSQVAGLAVSSWLSEKALITGYDWPCIAKLTCAHYSQIIWKNTKSFGCAVVHCSGNLANYVVCRYSPPGNIIGQTPYS